MTLSKRQHLNCFEAGFHAQSFLFSIFLSFRHSIRLFFALSNISSISIETTSFNCLFHLANSIKSNPKIRNVLNLNLSHIKKMAFNWNVHFDQSHSVKDTQFQPMYGMTERLILMHLFNFAIRLLLVPPLNSWWIHLVLRCWWRWVIYRL